MIDVHYSLFQCFEIDVTNTVELLPVCKNKPKYFEIILVVKTAYFFKHKKQISWDILLDKEKPFQMKTASSYHVIRILLLLIVC